MTFNLLFCSEETVSNYNQIRLPIPLEVASSIDDVFPALFEWLTGEEKLVASVSYATDRQWKLYVSPDDSAREHTRRLPSEVSNPVQDIRVSELNDCKFLAGIFHCCCFLFGLTNRAVSLSHRWHLRDQHPISLPAAPSTDYRCRGSGSTGMNRT